MPTRGYPGDPGATPLSTSREEVFRKEQFDPKEVVGREFQGRRGRYIVTDADKSGGILVKYIDGEWKGKLQRIDLTTHINIQRGIATEATVKETTEKEYINTVLDLWYEEYKGLYNAHHEPGILGKTLLRILEEEYPEAAENIQRSLE